MAARSCARHERLSISLDHSSAGETITMPHAIALVSDTTLYDAVCRQLAPLAFDCAYAFEAPDFWDMLPKRPYEVVLVESDAARVRPATFVSKVKRISPAATIVFLGERDESEPASLADASFLGLPLPEGALARRMARRTIATPVDAIEEIIGSSSAARNLKERIRLFAGVDSTVLIAGESGSGKELIARAVHAASARRSGPFVTVNCGAIPADIIESELFGHVKGSFTSAERDRAGHFELAEGGTLFLDEIGTMRLDHQVKLLRVLQDRAVTRVGSTTPISVDVRVVAATNADLLTLIESGRFREDLFYRLNVLLITVPPLRERRDDIPELARHFAVRIAQRQGLKSKEISPAAMERLMVHPWRGNVRELENAIEHAVVLSQGRRIIEPLDLPGVLGERRSGVNRGFLRLTPDGLDLNEAVSQIEREMILQSLAIARGNKSKAAELLHLKRTTFVEKMKRLELLEEDEAVLGA